MKCNGYCPKRKEICCSKCSDVECNDRCSDADDEGALRECVSINEAETMREFE